MPPHSHATFADDAVIFVSNSEPMNVYNGLQSQLNSLTDYFKQWKIKKNTSKTKAIYFTRRWSSRRLPSTRILLDGQGVPWYVEVKYLGGILDKRLQFLSHAAKSIEKTERAFWVLYSFLNRKPKLCLYSKLLLYKSCIRPFCVMGSKHSIISLSYIKKASDFPEQMSQDN
jgi:hypothetical protein